MAKKGGSESEDKARKAEDDEGQETSGVTEGVLRGLGKIIPGFGELVKGLEKSEAFRDRLEAADAEVERQLEKAPPLKKVGGTRRSVIPPRTTLKVSRNTLREEIAPPSRREVVPDIFDEGDYLMMIAELPGVDEKDIKAEMRENLLILSAQTTGQKYYEVDLPCLVKGKPNLTYKNGILQISIEKA
jgi:HSP20 family protein